MSGSDSPAIRFEGWPGIALHPSIISAQVGDRCVLSRETTDRRFCADHGVLGLPRYVDTRSENGYTAVHLAALSGTLACVQTLLESGASMMVRVCYCLHGQGCNQDQHTQLTRAQQLLMIFLTGVKPLNASPMFRQVRTVDQGRGGPYDIAPGSTPLHAAAFRGDVGIVQAVIQVQSP